MSPVVEQILAEFFVARDSGQHISVTQLIDSHPEQAEELKTCLDLYQNFEQFLNQCVRSADPLTSVNRYPIPFGSYDLIGELGTGGMGVVFRAKHRSTNRIVALKMLLGGRYASPAEQRRFQRETQAVMQLDHPNIVKVFTVDEWDGHAFFTMQLMAGGTLTQQRRDHPLSPQRVAAIVAELADAVQHAHQRGILHRDIKPTNILLDENSRAYLADFGLARLTETGSAGDAATITGTPGYMSPEQRHGSAITTATDVYGLGGILHFLLTGYAPHDSMPNWSCKIPRDLEAIRRKALADRPEDRYTTAHELKLDLQRFNAGQLVSARTPGLPERCWIPIRRNPVLSTLAFCTVLALLSTSYFAWRDSRSSRRLNVELANSLQLENTHRQHLEQANRELVLSNACQLFREGRTDEAGELVQNLPPLAGGHTSGLVENLLNRWTAQDRRWGCHDGVLLAMAVHPNGQSIATVGSEGQLVISDTRTGMRQQSWPLLRSSNARVAFHPEGHKLVVTLQDMTTKSRFMVSIYSLSGMPQQSILLDWSWLHGLAWNSDGRSLVLSGQTQDTRNVVMHWHPENQKLHNAEFDPDIEVHNLQCVPSSRLVMGSTWSHHREPLAELVFFPESPTAPPTYVPLNHSRWISSCDASPTGDKLAAIADDGSVFVLNAELMTVEWQHKQTQKIGEIGWHSLHWSDAGETITLLCKTAQGTEWKVLDAKTGEVRGKPISIQGQVSASTRSRLAKTLFYATGDNRLHRRLAPLPECDELHGHTGEVWTVAFHPDGQLLASGSDDGTIRLWDVATTRERAVLTGHTALVMAVAFSSDGQRLYSASWDQSIRIWDVRTGACLRHWLAHDAPIPYLAVAPDGTRLYTHARNGQTTVWDPATGQRLHTMTGDARKSVLFALSADGQQLAVSDPMRQITIWNTRTWTVENKIDQTGFGCGAGAFSRDGSELVLGRFAGVIETRNLHVGSTRTWHHEPDTAPTRLAISNDNRFVLVANDPSSPAHVRMVVCDRTTGKPMLMLPHPKAAFGLAFSPDSRLIATGCHDGIVRIWGRNQSDR